MMLQKLSSTLQAVLLVATSTDLIYTNVGSSTTAYAAAPEICPTMFADFHNRQLKVFESDVPFYQEEGTSSKHIPFLTISGDGKTGTVVVGDGDKDGGVWHPMVASNILEQVHFITHLMVKDQEGKVVVLEPMDPTAGAPAKMEFAVPAGATKLTPYNWCNLHGLWIGPHVDVPFSEEGDSTVCGVSHFPNKAWESVHTDFMRLQMEPPHNSPIAFTEVAGEKHTPFIALNDDGTASVLVGRIGGSVHPMTGSPDGVGTPHWITEIYVMDQSRKIVAMSTLDSADEYATMNFTVPEGTTQVQAYAWCNIHGLWASAAVEVESAGMVGGTIIPGEPSGGVNSRAASSAAFLSAFLSASLLVVTY